MPQGQPHGGRREAPGRPAAASVFGLVWSKRSSLPAGVGKAASLAKEGDGCCVGTGAVPRMGRWSLCLKASPGRQGAGTQLGSSALWFSSESWVQPHLLQPLPFAAKGLQRGPSCNEFDCCFSTINSFNFFHFKYLSRK